MELKDLNSAYLVMAATSDRKINSLVSSYCRKKGILINVVDFPQEIRLQAIKKIKGARARKVFFQKLLQPQILSLFKRNKEKQAKIRIGTYFRDA